MKAVFILVSNQICAFNETFLENTPRSFCILSRRTVLGGKCTIDQLVEVLSLLCGNLVPAKRITQALHNHISAVLLLTTLKLVLPLNVENVCLQFSSNNSLTPKRR